MHFKNYKNEGKSAMEMANGCPQMNWIGLADTTQWYISWDKSFPKYSGICNSFFVILTL